MSNTHFCYSGDGIFRDTSQCKMNYGSPRNAVRVSAFSSVNCSLLAGDAAGRQAVKTKLCTSAELQKAQVQLHSSSSASVWRVHLLDLLPASCKAIPFISQTLSSQRKSQYTKKVTQESSKIDVVLKLVQKIAGKQQRQRHFWFTFQPC